MSTIATSEPELIPHVPDKWVVITKYHDKEKTLPKGYELHFQGACQDKRKGAHGYEVLKLTAKHLNRINAVPRKRVMCAADSPNPQRYLADSAR